MATKSRNKSHARATREVPQRLRGPSAQNLATVKGEPDLWESLRPIAEKAITFWEAFMDLKKGDDDDLAAIDREHLLRIVRAVLWVESKHGTVGANEPARDPMQVGNPDDQAWPQFAGAVVKKDRYVRGPKYSVNYWANELPGAVSGESTFPKVARVSELGDPADGHDDAKFNATMSIYWGIAHLIWKTNVPAGRKAYCFDSVSRAELKSGAVKYNGGGDPNYGAKIEAALTEQGWPARGVQDLSEFARLDISPLTSALAAVCEQVGDGKLFPRGISNIELAVTLPGGAGVSLKVSGAS